MPTDSHALHRRLGGLIVPVSRAYRKYVDNRLASLPLSHSSALAVMVLGRLGDGVRQGVLAEHLGLEGPTIVPMIDRMERAGLVERHVDPDDKRARTVHLTAMGRDVAEQAEAMSAAVREEVFAGIDQRDLDATARVLEHLQAVIDADAERG